MRTIRPGWPALLGVLGGLVAAEAQLALELGPWRPFDVSLAHLLGLATGLLGPLIVIALERRRLLARSLGLGPGPRLHATLGWSAVGGAAIGFWAVLSSGHFVRHVAMPLRFVDPRVSVFGTASVVGFAAIFLGLGFRRFQRWFVPRFAIALVFTLATVGLCAWLLGMDIGPT